MKIDELVLAKCIKNIDPWGDKETVLTHEQMEAMQYRVEE